MKKLDFMFIVLILVVMPGCKTESTSKRDDGSEAEAVEFEELKQEFKEVYYDSLLRMRCSPILTAQVCGLTEPYSYPTEASVTI